MNEAWQGSVWGLLRIVLFYLLGNHGTAARRLAFLPQTFAKLPCGPVNLVMMLRRIPLMQGNFFA
jgi:hypothetical protein